MHQYWKSSCVELACVYLQAYREEIREVRVGEQSWFT